jgi:hypothetical protein
MKENDDAYAPNLERCLTMFLSLGSSLLTVKHLAKFIVLDQGNDL